MHGDVTGPTLWTVSFHDLERATPRLPPLHVHPRADKPRGLDGLVARLDHHGLLPTDRARRMRIVRALRGVRMELFCGYFMPRSASTELFDLAVMWTAVLWLADDALDKADSPASLRYAVDAHRARLIPAIEGRLPKHAASPLTNLVSEYFRRLEQVAPAAVCEDFRKAALGWLHDGALCFADATLQRAPLSVAAHIEARRWDGAVDCCQANLAACLSDLPEGFLARADVSALRRVGAAHIALLNDLVSYELEVGGVVRDAAFRADTNIVTAVQRERACSEAQAATRVVDILGELSETYGGLAAQIATGPTAPASGTKAQQAIATFVEGVGRMMQGNLQWSERSGRYRSQKAPLSFLRAGIEADRIPLLRLNDPQQAVTRLPRERPTR